MNTHTNNDYIKKINSNKNRIKIITSVITKTFIFNVFVVDIFVFVAFLGTSIKEFKKIYRLDINLNVILHFSLVDYIPLSLFF